MRKNKFSKKQKTPQMWGFLRIKMKI